MIRFLLLVFIICIELFSNEYSRVAFKGNKDFFDATLYDALGIKNKDPLLKLQKDDNTTVEPQEIEDNLLDFYNSKGYYKCDVSYGVSGDKVTFNIDENAPVKIENFVVNSPIKIKKFLTLERGDTFDADKFAEMKRLIRRYLDENGYPKAKIVSGATINIDPYQAFVELNVTNVKISKISHITIPKIDALSQKSIRQKLTFREGDKFDIREIEKSRDNLYLTDIFSTVRIDLEETNGDIEDENVSLVITLEKGKQRSVKASIGYSSDEGPRMKFSWVNKNAFDDFRRLETSLKLTRDSQAADASIIVPEFIGLPFDDKVSVEQDRYAYLGYSDKRVTNVFRFEFNIMTTKHFIGLKTEHGLVSADTQSQYIKNQDYMTNAILYEYLLDTRDSKLDPTAGHMINMNVEFADNVLASTLNYVKGELEGRQIISFPYTSIFSDLSFAFRGKIGVVDDLKQSYIPIFNRFFAGGSFSNRGYSYNRMGQQDGYGNYIGGKTLIDASSEARYKVTQKFSTVAFFDTTLLAYKSFDYTEKYHPSVGAGVRYETGVGPIRFDVGVPVGEQKRSPVFHISFGQAF